MNISNARKRIFTKEQIEELINLWAKHYVPERWIRKEFELGEKLYRRLKMEHCSYEQIKFLPQNFPPEIFEKILLSCENNKPYKEIAEELNLKHKQVRKIIVKLGKFYNVKPIPKPKYIPTPKHREKLGKILAQYNRENPKSKENNPNWKGGTTKLAELIRKSDRYKKWRLEVFKRDEFSCINCSSKNTIQADHIYPFSLLLKDGKITTVKEALEFPQLWNVKNGRTLCLECHRKTKSFGRKATNLMRNLHEEIS